MFFRVGGFSGFSGFVLRERRFGERGADAEDEREDGADEYAAGARVEWRVLVNIGNVDEEQRHEAARLDTDVLESEAARFFFCKPVARRPSPC